MVSIEIPESDEAIWILLGLNVEEAGDVADNVRREIKRGLSSVEYYDQAREFVIRKLQDPPLTEEEQQAIGTVSAGVANYTRGVESLLSDISSAVKESKFRGRNRTVIYQREQPSIIRPH